jgi:hypothetical protein
MPSISSDSGKFGLLFDIKKTEKPSFAAIRAAIA